MLTLLTATVVLAACAGLRCFLNRPERKDAFFWGGRIRLTALWNDGAAFSLPLKRTLVTALSILILPLVWVFRRRSPIGAGLALGGGLSNLWERLRRGAVYDYVQFPKLPKIGRYVWNLADLAILIGGLLLAPAQAAKPAAAISIVSIRRPPLPFPSPPAPYRCWHSSGYSATRYLRSASGPPSFPRGRR